MAVTTAAVVGIAGGLASAGMSFKSAADQKRQANQARSDQKRLMADARQKAEKDFYAGLNVPLDAFGEQYRQNIGGQQQVIQSLQEGDTRNLIGGVAGVTAAAGQGTENTRIAMGQELYDNRKMKADSKQNVNQQLLQMDVGAAADESMRERDLLEARAANIQGGFAGIGQVAQGIDGLTDLYGKSGGQGRAERLYSGLDQSQVSAAAGGELSRAQQVNRLRGMDYTGKQTRQMLRGKAGGEQFDYRIFDNLYVAPE
tara:strand:+ start:272 stop:1042 length:771 start_codon:yes stop_codon:yes gene_type:complete